MLVSSAALYKVKFKVAKLALAVNTPANKVDKPAILVSSIALPDKSIVKVVKVSGKVGKAVTAVKALDPEASTVKLITAAKEAIHVSIVV